jgi:hypothetical protein
VSMLPDHLLPRWGVPDVVLFSVRSLKKGTGRPSQATGESPLSPARPFQTAAGPPNERDHLHERRYGLLPCGAILACRLADFPPAHVLPGCCHPALRQGLPAFRSALSACPNFQPAQWQNPGPAVPGSSRWVHSYSCLAATAGPACGFAA